MMQRYIIYIGIHLARYRSKSGSYTISSVRQDPLIISQRTGAVESMLLKQH